MKRLLLLSLTCLLLVQCQRERDKYYEAPEWAGKPLYDVLQEQGRFSKYLACVDKTLYKASFHGNGLWTVLAPNDEAMAAYMAKRGYSTVDDIPQDTLNMLVAYSMLYNKYNVARLTDILGGGVWDSIASMKKQTPYYTLLHREIGTASDSVWVINPTRGNVFTYGTHSVDNNYKYLPFYMQRIFAARPTPLTDEDYNTFYPSSKYTGYNVQAYSMVEGGMDMEAGNGVAHEVNGVNMPLPNLEDILQGDPSYSEFWRIINKRSMTNQPLFYTLTYSAQVTNYFKKAFPEKNIDQVFVKFYGLDVPINSERYWDPVDNVSPEQDGFTLFAPTNTAMQQFVNDRIAEYGYSSVDSLPVALIEVFINAHFVGNSIWPKEFMGAKNSAENFINGVGARPIGEAKPEDLTLWSKGTLSPRPASNGFFYGVNNYVRSPYFESVLAELLLNSNIKPDLSSYYYFYSALTAQNNYTGTLLNDLAFCTLNGHYEEDYILLAINDGQFQRDGFYFTDGAFTHTGGVTLADNRMPRLIRSHIFRRVHNRELDTRIFRGANKNQNPLGDDYGGVQYALNDYGEVVKFKGDEDVMQVQMPGNAFRNEWVTATKVHRPVEFLNGNVYTVDKMLQYSVSPTTEDTIVKALERIKAINPNISKSVDYLIFLATVATDYGGKVANSFELNPKSFYTLFLPNNAAIDSAMAHGILYSGSDARHEKGLSTLKYQLGSTSDPVQLAKLVGWVNSAIDFFKYHVSAGAEYIDDGYEKLVLNDGKYLDYVILSTQRKVQQVNSTFLRLSKASGHLMVETYRSAKTGNALVVRGEKRSNLAGPRFVVHEILVYLEHEPIEE